MAAKSGRLMLVKLGDAKPATTYSAIMTSRSDSFTINNESIDVSNKNHNRWASTITGTSSCEISLEGVFEGTTEEAKLTALAISGETWPMQIIDSAGTWQGEFSITSYTTSGAYNDGITYSVSLSNYGEVTFTPAP